MNKVNTPKVNTSFILSLLFLFVCSTTAYAQTAPSYQVKGIVIDSATSKPVEFATVVVTDEDRKAIAMTYSDESGLFQAQGLNAGRYILVITFVGYATKEIRFALSGSSGAIDMGKIPFAELARQLGEVTITGMRQLIDQQPGMLIYNADRDISNQGGTAADVLRKAPILNVDAAGNVTMRGNSNLRILINGKYSGQMARNAADALNMMPANTIKSVEVITSPSARYDAEGAAGVINIITKRSEQMSGNLEMVAGNLEQAINPRIAFSRNKWTVSSYLHLHRFRLREETDLDRVTLDNGVATGLLRQTDVRDNVNPHSSGDLQVEYAADSLTTWSFSVNGWLGNWPQNNDQHTQRFSPDGSLVEAYRQRSDTDAPTKGVDINIGYTRKFRKPGEELYLMVQHNRESDEFNYDARQTDAEELLIYREVNDNRNQNHEWTFQSDYILPLSSKKEHALEAGAKVILRNNSSIYSVMASADEDPDVLVPVGSRTDVFTYSQDVAAAYSQLKFKWRQGWALHAGARLEATFLEGDQQNQATNFKNQFWNFVPSATLFRKINADNNLTLSYTQRISRPSIWDLNPNRNTQDPNNIEVGNPLLRPEILHQVEFTYALQTDRDIFVNASLFGRQTNNSIESFISTDDQGVSTVTKQNLASNKQFGLNLSTAFNPLPLWKINSNAYMSYARFHSEALDISNDGTLWGVNLNSSWALREEISLQAYGEYDARKVLLQGEEGQRFYYSFSAKKEITSLKLTVTLTATNPFSKYLRQNEFTRGDDFESQVHNRYMIRSFRLSVNWEFGGLFRESERRRINNDDQKNRKASG